MNKIRTTPNVSLSHQDYLEKRKKNILFIFSARIFLLLAFLFFWQTASDLHWINSFFFSSPLQIITLFFSMLKENTLLPHLYITLKEVIASFLIVTFLSLFSAMILFLSPTAAKIIEPFLVMMNSLPKSALAPLIIVWMGTGISTIVTTGASVALFGSIINMYTGFKEVSGEKIKLIYSLGGSKKDVLFLLILPSSLPLMISNMKVNIGLSLVGIIIGEFLAAKEGLGYLIIYSSQIFHLDLLILSVVLLCFLSSCLYGLIQWAENHLLYTKKHSF